ncbi:MAG: hypothetical protein ACYST6_10220 [Planctomycetota bacterium]|jgi:hypothetical protein
MTEQEQNELRFKAVFDQQLKFERDVEERLRKFMETVTDTIAEAGVVNEGQTLPDARLMHKVMPVVGDRPTDSDTVDPPLPQLPISIRYRNDGGSGTHRLEWINRPTPFSDAGETTMWPDDDWTPIEGADAEIYSP